MPGDKPKRSYWDSCVFLALINGETDRVTVISELLESARKGEIEVVTSVLTITEVAHATVERQSGSLSSELLRKIDALWEPPSPVKLAEFHRLIAEGARDLMRRALQEGRRLKPADAIHLSTAARNRCDEVLTYDKLTGYADMVGVKISEPSCAVQPLPYEGTIPANEAPSQ
jgi:predicted nucleic acid-binding protein